MAAVSAFAALRLASPRSSGTADGACVPSPVGCEVPSIGRPARNNVRVRSSPAERTRSASAPSDNTRGVATTARFPADCTAATASRRPCTSKKSRPTSSTRPLSAAAAACSADRHRTDSLAGRGSSPRHSALRPPSATVEPPRGLRRRARLSMQPYSRSRADNASPSSIACSRCAFASAAAVLRASSSATAARRRVAFTSPAGKKRPAAIAESSSSEDPKRWPGFSDSSLGVPNRSSTPSRTSSLSRNVPIALRSAAEVRGARCATSRGTSDCATTLTPSASVSRSCSGEPRLPLATARTRDEPSGGTPSEASAWAAGNSSRGGAPWADVCALAPAPPNCLRNIDLVAASRAWSFVRHTMSPAWTRERSSAPRRKLITTSVAQCEHRAALLLVLTHAAPSAIEHDAVAALEASRHAHNYLRLGGTHIRHLTDQHAAVAGRAPAHKALVAHAFEEAWRQAVVLGILPTREDLPERRDESLAFLGREPARRCSRGIRLEWRRGVRRALILPSFCGLPRSIDRCTISPRCESNILGALQPPFDLETGDARIDQLGNKVNGHKVLRREQVLHVAELCERAIDQKSVWQPACLRALSPISRAAAPALRG
eukprot:scaffold9829_cov26-Tisochrysis_lutea.AAC.3